MFAYQVLLLLLLAFALARAQCPANTIYINSQCVPTSCSPPNVLQNGVCVNPNATQCANGQVYVNGGCSNIIINIYPGSGSGQPGIGWVPPNAPGQVPCPNQPLTPYPPLLPQPTPYPPTQPNQPTPCPNSPVTPYPPVQPNPYPPTNQPTPSPYPPSQPNQPNPCPNSPVTPYPPVQPNPYPPANQPTPNPYPPSQPNEPNPCPNNSVTPYPPVQPNPYPPTNQPTPSPYPPFQPNQPTPSPYPPSQPSQPDPCPNSPVTPYPPVQPNPYPPSQPNQPNPCPNNPVTPYPPTQPNPYPPSQPSQPDPCPNNPVTPYPPAQPNPYPPSQPNQPDPCPNNPVTPYPPVQPTPNPDAPEDTIPSTTTSKGDEPLSPPTTPPPAPIIKCPEGSILLNGKCRLVYCSSGIYSNGRCVQTRCPPGTTWTGQRCAEPKPIELGSIHLEKTIINAKVDAGANLVIHNVNNLVVNASIALTPGAAIDYDEYDGDDEEDKENESSSTAPGTGKCCNVIAPRICRGQVESVKWKCFSRTQQQCGDFCSASKVILKPSNVTSWYDGDDEMLIMPPNWVNQCQDKSKCDQSKDHYDCSGCAAGLVATCSSYCYTYRCSSHNCAFYDQEQYCQQYAGQIGCRPEDGWFQ